MTYLELAKDEASKLGIVLDDGAAEYILWERTPFPCIGGEEALRTYIHKELAEHWRSFKPKTKGPTAWDKVNADDAVAASESWPSEDLLAVFKALPEEVQELALAKPKKHGP